VGPREHHLPLNLPFALILQVNHHMRSSIFGFEDRPVYVHGLSPQLRLQIVYGRQHRAVQGWASKRPSGAWTVCQPFHRAGRADRLAAVCPVRFQARAPLYLRAARRLAWSSCGTIRSQSGRVGPLTGSQGGSILARRTTEGAMISSKARPAPSQGGWARRSPRNVLCMCFRDHVSGTSHSRQILMPRACLRAHGRRILLKRPIKGINTLQRMRREGEGMAICIRPRPSCGRTRSGPGAGRELASHR
jgi:hypothetical protein